MYSYAEENRVTSKDQRRPLGEPSLNGTTLTVWAEPSETTRSRQGGMTRQEIVEASETYWRSEHEAYAREEKPAGLSGLPPDIGVCHPDPLAQLSTAEVLAEYDDSIRDALRGERRKFRSILGCGRLKMWKVDDCRSLVQWVSQREGITYYRARRFIRCAYALPFLPLIDHAYQAGQLSTDKLVELVRMATPDNQEELLEWATSVSVTAVKERADEVTRIKDPDVRNADGFRSFRWRFDKDDLTRIVFSGSMPAHDALKVIEALERIMAELPESPVDPEDPEQLADAKRADALVELATNGLSDNAETPRDTVVVHVPVEALDGSGNAIVNGHPIAPGIAERLQCDARLQIVIEDSNRQPVKLGTTAHNIPRRLRRQILYRDRFRCTFPNCGSKRGLDIHHIVPWPKGPTEPDNLICLCRRHHKTVHEYGWHVQLKDGKTHWFRPNWEPFRPGPPVPDRTEAAPEPQPTLNFVFDQILEELDELEGAF